MRAAEEVRGSLYIFISAFMYATLPIFAKLAYAAGLTPGTALILRYVFSFLLLACLIKIGRQGKVLIMSPIVLVQGIFLSISGVFYFLALKTLSAGLTTVIFFTHPVIVSILSMFIYKERFNPRLFAALVLALSGIALVSGLGSNPDSLNNNGVLMALLACLGYSIYSLISQKSLVQNQPLSITATMSLLAVIIILPIYHSDWGFITNLTWQQSLITLAMAIFNTLLAIWFFLKGIQKIGASHATLLSTAEPVFCLVLAFLILGERLNYVEISGSLMVLASMFLAVKSVNRLA